MRARPRPGNRAPLADALTPANTIEAVVDAELGILLRCEHMSGGQTVRLAELRDVRLHPPEAADPSRFEPPAAELHQWLSPQAMLEQARWVAGGGGFGAVARHTPGRLADAIRERAPDHHQVARMRLAAPDRYRIDYISGEARSAPKTTACDGQRRWRV
ncbi:MAG TPA: hypothetical protein VIV12_08400 [Streptosporangiaceae bacterium]